MKYRINKTLAVLLAAASLAPAALAHKVEPAAWRHYQDVRLGAMINPNGNRSVARKYTWLNKRLSITGLINVDGVYFSRGWNRATPVTPGVVPNHVYGVSNANDITVNNMNLLLDARINRYTTAHASLVFRDNPGPGPFRILDILDDDGTDCKGYPDLNVDEAYITLGNMKDPHVRYYVPFYLRVGREYIPFGHYRDPYPLTYSFTQLLSQSNQNVIQLGYVARQLGPYGNAHSFYGSVFAFNGAHSGPEEVDDVDEASTSRIRNWGAKLGYKSNYRTLDYELAASYLRDIRDIDFFSRSFDCDGDYESTDPAYRRSAAFSLYASARKGPFELMGNYVSATRTIFFEEDGDLGTETRMWAYTLLGGYRFYTYGARSKFELSYQHTGEMKFADCGDFPDDTTLMPEWRLEASYRVALGHYTALVLEYNHTRGYRNVSSDSSNDETNDNSSNQAKARLSVHF